jgi:uncharacterized protein
MRIMDGTEESFEKILDKKDRIIYNLFYLIREGDNAFFATDNSTYIIGQGNESAPLWMWLKQIPDENVEKEICAIIESRVVLNQNLQLNAYEGYARGILDRVSNKTGIGYYVSAPMIAYACNQAISRYKISGQIVTPEEKHKEIMAKFITQFIAEITYDAEKTAINENKANGFANAMVNSNKLFLWEDGGKIVSMAMIAHRTREYARINTVFTEREQRGKGYAGMLLGKMSRKLLEENLIPMLYADSRNPASNAAYQKIGFQAVSKLHWIIHLG